MISKANLISMVVALGVSLLGVNAMAKTKTSSKRVVVNGVVLKTKTVTELEKMYRTKIKSGRYWYDSVSGLWGYQGGPAAGQVYPGLNVGGKLKSNASNGNTGVFVNGRELHGLEVAYLKRMYGQVQRGRYWVLATGVGGFEGGPAFFNLRANNRSSKRSLTGGYSVTGGVLGGGGVVGYTNSKGVGITCGPDGGCF